MKLYPEPLDPSELKDYEFDWSPKLGEGEAVASILAVEFVDAAGTSKPNQSLASPVTRVWLTGGNDGQRAVFSVRVRTSGGRDLEEAFGVDIVDSAAVAPTLAALKQQLAEAEEARHKLALGFAVVDVWKDGRRVRYQPATSGALDSYIDALRVKIAAEVADPATTLPRRRFIPMAFG